MVWRVVKQRGGKEIDDFRLRWRPQMGCESRSGNHSRVPRIDSRREKDENMLLKKSIFPFWKILTDAKEYADFEFRNYR